MKNKLIIIVLLTFGSFFTIPQNNVINAQTLKNHELCSRKRHFGDITVCLPVIKGMVECYSNPSIKKRMNNLYYSKGNTILGVYINSNVYKNASDLDKVQFGEFIFVYAPNQLKGININNSLLAKFSSATENYLKMSWKELKEEIDKKHDYLFTIKKPILLKTYMVGKKISISVLLIPLKVKDHTIINVEILNIMEIKHRLICSLYYTKFNGIESVKSAQKKNENMALKLVILNK